MNRNDKLCQGTCDDVLQSNLPKITYSTEKDGFDNLQPKFQDAKDSIVSL